MILIYFSHTWFSTNGISLAPFYKKKKNTKSISFQIVLEIHRYNLWVEEIELNNQSQIQLIKQLKC